MEMQTLNTQTCCQFTNLCVGPVTLDQRMLSVDRLVLCGDVSVPEQESAKSKNGEIQAHK